MTQTQLNGPQSEPVLREALGEGSHRLLLLASTGGHLAQLVRMAEAQGASADSVWVTFDSPQSRSLLHDRNVVWVDYVAPRDFKALAQAHADLRTKVDPTSVSGVVSTGAGLALAGFAWAREHRLPAAYIESVSRTGGPSLTGRIVRTFRLARTFTQHATWANRHWQLVPSVMRQFERVDDSSARDDRPLRVLVTLGTIRPYRFDALVDGMMSILRHDDEVIWQLGETTRTDLPGRCNTLMGADEFLDEARAADVVVTHAGVGTILQLLDNGISPVVVPRRKIRGEHVDDHQMQIFGLLGDAGIAVPAEVNDLSRDTLLIAANTSTISKATA